MRTEQVTAPHAHHGEGPVWDDALGRLFWVDMLRGDVLSMSPGADEVARVNVGAVAGSVAPRAAGGHVVSTERGFCLIEASGAIKHLPDVWDDDTVRMNDGACDPAGRFYSGSMAYDATPGRGALYRLDADHSVHTVLTGVTISNGLGWSPDATTAYYIDTPTGRVDAVDSGTAGADFTARRPFASIDASAGVPDGLTVDAEGGVWVALWGGSALHRYTSTGALDRVVEIPVQQPTSCAFGGDNLATLYITTSAEGLSDPEPGAGAVFAVEPGVTGQPTLTYAG